MSNDTLAQGVKEDWLRRHLRFELRCVLRQLRTDVVMEWISPLKGSGCERQWVPGEFVPPLCEPLTKLSDEAVQVVSSGDVEIGSEARCGVAEPQLQGATALHQSLGKHLADYCVGDNDPRLDAASVEACDPADCLVE